jgi:PAS domain S-box-containing protein
MKMLACGPDGGTRVTAGRKQALYPFIVLFLLPNATAAAQALVEPRGWNPIISGALARSPLLLLAFTFAIACLAMMFYVRALRHRNRMLESELGRQEEANSEMWRDIAALREKEGTWRASEERFRSLTTLSADCYWEQDSEFRFTLRSPWTLGLDQVPVEDYVGKTRWDLATDSSDISWDRHRAILESHQPFRGFEYQFLHRGKAYWVSINGEPRFDSNGTFIGYCGTAHDISRRKDIEAALRASEERFQEIISFMPVGLVIKDAQGRITLMNPECERVWGVSQADMVGTDGSEFFSPEEMARFRDADRRAYESRDVIEHEETVRNVLTGELKIVRGLKKPVFGKAGEARYLIGVSLDITCCKDGEELLRMSEERLRRLAIHQNHVKEQERKRIARDIHDDLGQNLLALRLEVAALVQRTMIAHPRLNQRARSVIENIDVSIRSMRNVINDLRPAALDLGLVAALEWQVVEFTKRSAITCNLKVEVGDELEMDELHATALFRVFQESLSNVLRHASASSVQVRLQRDADWLHLTVKDNGIGGVHPEDRRNMQAFGLLGMKERVGALGGRLKVSSGPQGGTTLEASLPLARQTSPSDIPATPVASDDQSWSI